MYKVKVRKILFKDFNLEQDFYVSYCDLFYSSTTSSVVRYKLLAVSSEVDLVLHHSLETLSQEFTV